MKVLIKMIRHCAEDKGCDGCGYYHTPGRCMDAILRDAANAIEKLNTWNDELIKEVAWLKSCKNCKIYAECPRHGAKTVHGCDHWVDACERMDGDE